MHMPGPDYHRFNVAGVPSEGNVGLPTTKADPWSPFIPSAQRRPDPKSMYDADFFRHNAYK